MRDSGVELSAGCWARLSRWRRARRRRNGPWATSGCPVPHRCLPTIAASVSWRTFSQNRRARPRTVGPRRPQSSGTHGRRVTPRPRRRQVHGGPRETRTRPVSPDSSRATCAPAQTFSADASGLIPNSDGPAPDQHDARAPHSTSAARSAGASGREWRARSGADDRRWPPRVNNDGSARPARRRPIRPKIEERVVSVQRVGQDRAGFGCDQGPIGDDDHEGQLVAQGKLGRRGAAVDQRCGDQSPEDTGCRILGMTVQAGGDGERVVGPGGGRRRGGQRGRRPEAARDGDLRAHASPRCGRGRGWKWRPARRDAMRRHTGRRPLLRCGHAGTRAGSTSTWT